MTDLVNKKAVPTREGDKPLSDEEVRRLLKEVPGWKLEYSNTRDLCLLARTYPFKTYELVLTFHQNVGGLAEEEQHHPEMITQYGDVTIRWWTHTVGGVHMNDFVLAAKCDRLYQESQE
ncbi:MAG: 4a-hydroxytetrahydrobiopterin dehydratase [Gammaproteobacteria bacterium]|nr:4a-hydroxytetrahydrobiopterin dehydratase [Gammaproteobacteria bacterium]